MSTIPIDYPNAGESPLVSGKHFVLVGAGSLGSRAAELLAAAGAAEIVLVDHDVLEPPNLRRHLCGVEHLGRPKADAVADTLRERGFPTIFRALQGRVQVELADQVREMIATTDLVLCATDSAPPRQFVNHAALHAGVPSIIANVQLRPQPLAEIVSTIPGAGGCWNCWRTQLERDGVMSRATGHDPADYPDASPPAPSGLPMYQLTAVAATACDLAGVALAGEPRSSKWLMVLDTPVADFPSLPAPRVPLLEELEQLATCEVCAR
ncbi:MAG: HesA/MoeB/ThiF family protein [Solirubrobacteraceae bacterium]